MKEIPMNILLAPIHKIVVFTAQSIFVISFIGMAGRKHTQHLCRGPTTRGQHYAIRIFFSSNALSEFFMLNVERCQLASDQYPFFDGMESTTYSNTQTKQMWNSIRSRIERTMLQCYIGSFNLEYTNFATPQFVYFVI